jgi:hypothetical protein
MTKLPRARTADAGEQMSVNAIHESTRTALGHLHAPAREQAGKAVGRGPQRHGVQHRIAGAEYTRLLPMFDQGEQRAKSRIGRRLRQILGRLGKTAGEHEPVAIGPTYRVANDAPAGAEKSRSLLAGPCGGGAHCAAQLVEAARGHGLEERAPIGVVPVNRRVRDPGRARSGGHGECLDTLRVEQTEARAHHRFGQRPMMVAAPFFHHQMLAHFQADGPHVTD